MTYNKYMVKSTIVVINKNYNNCKTGRYMMSEECSHNCSSCGSDCAERAVPQNTRNDNNKNDKKITIKV